MIKTAVLLGVMLVVSLLLWLTPPKPTIRLIHTSNGGVYFHLDCPKGWVGYSEWTTDFSLGIEDQMEQYRKDAERGVCKRP